MLRRRAGSTLFLALAGGLWLATGSDPTAAQTLPSGTRLPPSAEPIPQIPLQLTPAPGAQSAPPPLVIPGPSGNAPPAGVAGVKVDIAAIRVEGAAVYGASELDALTRDGIGQGIPVSRLFEIADRIERKYRADGYVLSRAFVPEQTVGDGRFVIAVTEGYISSALIDGEVGEARAPIERYLATITTERPVRLATVERALLLINDIPGISARSVLRAADQAGASQLVVEAQRKPFDAVADINNRGSRFTGPFNGAVSVAANSFTAFGDRTELLAYSTPDNEQQFAQASIGGLLGGDLFGGSGLSWRFTGGYTHTRPGYTLRQFDVVGESGFFTAHLTDPIIRSRQGNLTLDLGFDYQDTTTDILGAQFNDDRLRVLRLLASGDYRDGFLGLNTGAIGLHRGLPIFDATRTGSPTASRLGGRSDFTKLTFDGSRLQGLWSEGDRSLNLLAAVSAQYAFDTLLAPEEFRLGGERFGRGYYPSEITGPSGVGTSLEIQYNDRTTLLPIQRYQLYAFYDFGAVFANRQTAGFAEQTLASAGIGTRLAITDWLSGELETARPLTRRPVDVRSQFYYIRLTSRF